MAASFEGPKILRPDAWKTSTMPAARETSGPTTVRSMPSANAKSFNSSTCVSLIGTHSACCSDLGRARQRIHYGVTSSATADYQYFSFPRIFHFLSFYHRKQFHFPFTCCIPFIGPRQLPFKSTNKNPNSTSHTILSLSDILSGLLSRHPDGCKPYCRR